MFNLYLLADSDITTVHIFQPPLGSLLVMFVTNIRIVSKEVKYCILSSYFVSCHYTNEYSDTGMASKCDG